VGARLARIRGNTVSGDDEHDRDDAQHNDHRQKRSRDDHGDIQQEHGSLLDEEKIALIEQSGDAQKVEMCAGHQIAQRVQDRADTRKCARQPAAECRYTF
jgi:hypothetical protein